jgi:hypothetical protein
MTSRKVNEGQREEHAGALRNGDTQARYSGIDEWQTASPELPCCGCGKTDWCGISPDGKVAACRRVGEGAFREKKDKNGATYYLHRNPGAVRPSKGLKPQPRQPRAAKATALADEDTRHKVYTALLNHLTLSAAHKDDLAQRGLTDQVIEQGQYRTIASYQQARIGGSLGKEYEQGLLLKVPGFYMTKQAKLSLASPAGLLLPVRNLEGKIVALKKLSQYR